MSRLLLMATALMVSLFVSGCGRDDRATAPSTSGSASTAETPRTSGAAASAGASTSAAGTTASSAPAATAMAGDQGATSGSGAGGTAGSGDAAELMKSKGCFSCHDREAKKVGPSFKEIASKKKDKDALVAKLREGKGHMKIPASEAEINTMVQAVLATK